MSIAKRRPSRTPTVTQRRLGLAAIAATAVTMLLLPYLALWSALPEPVASHFTTSGTPDGSMSRSAFLSVCGVLVAFGSAALLVLATRRTSLPEGSAPYVGFLGGVVAILGAGIAAATAWTQRDLDSWQDARFGVVATALPLVVALMVGAVAARLASGLPMRRAADVSPTPPLTLAADEHAVWIGRIVNRPFQVLGATLVAVAVVGAFRLSWATAIAMFAIAVIFLALSTVRVVADRTGVTVRYGLLPWPRTSISLENIDAATAIDVRPMQWGGWGYRGSLRLAKQAAVVIRAGIGLRLDLTRGRVFVVTVDDAGAAAALLTAEIARRPNERASAQPSDRD